LKIFRQTLLEIFSADLARKIFIAIMILIENLIRINQTLVVSTSEGSGDDPPAALSSRQYFSCTAQGFVRF
jgi:hypothetical protein